MALAYDPYNNPSFGFAIVVISQLEEDSNWYEFEVYSSKTRKWLVSNAKIEISSFMLWIRDAVAESLASGKRIFPVQYVGGEVVWFLIKFKKIMLCAHSTRGLKS
ncbi:hypothetical protein Sjap_006992 [Stephania japonica]|uniref:Uncharacterized protein n=1 Tax=Stephania japonica TaxID=461633 RepID=A0AAP0K8F4_9MAGN